jgi:predicted methyltransferase
MRTPQLSSWPVAAKSTAIRATKDYAKGVWALPLIYTGEQDKTHFAANGESDQMTLTFRKNFVGQ